MTGNKERWQKTIFGYEDDLGKRERGKKRGKGNKKFNEYNYYIPQPYTSLKKAESAICDYMYGDTEH